MIQFIKADDSVGEVLAAAANAHITIHQAGWASFRPTTIPASTGIARPRSRDSSKRLK